MGGRPGTPPTPPRPKNGEKRTTGTDKGLEPLTLAGAAVLYLSAAKAKDVHTLDDIKVKFKTTAKVVTGGLRVVFVRVSAAWVLSVGVRRGVLALLLRRRGLLPPLLQLLLLQGRHGLLSFVVGIGVGLDVGVRGWLQLVDLPAVLSLHRLSLLLVAALPPLSPPCQGTACS